VKLLSKIIKSSRIKGEYQIDELKIDKKVKKEPAAQEIQSAETDPNKEALAEKYQAIVKEAKDEAATILQAAEAEAAEIKTEAKESGYQAGYEAGQEEAAAQVMEQFRKKLTGFDQLTDQFSAKLDQEIENLTPQVIDLAVQIAKRVINTKLELDGEYINHIVADILKDVFDYDKIRVRVSDELIGIVNNFEKAEFNQELEFIADKSLGLADCVIETNFGGKDGRLDNKLQLIKEELLKGAGYHASD